MSQPVGSDDHREGHPQAWEDQSQSRAFETQVRPRLTDSLEITEQKYETVSKQKQFLSEEKEEILYKCNELSEGTVKLK